jgi:hypothetical protein
VSVIVNASDYTDTLEVRYQARRGSGGVESSAAQWHEPEDRQTSMPSIADNRIGFEFDEPVRIDET